MKLYELTGAFLEVQQAIEDGNEDLKDTLESIDMAFEAKVEGIYKLYRNTTAEIDGLEAEENRLKDEKKRRQNSIEWMKAYLLESMKAVKKDKVKTSLGTVSVLPGKYSVSIDDASLIPKDYQKIVEPKFDKDRLKKDLEEGKKVKGASLVKNPYLLIK